MPTSESSAPISSPSVTGGFDAQHPPDPKLIDACVHCGFCLTTCPSYRVLGTEMDSPRGRIYLMDAINTGEAPLSATSAQHFDSCLGCLACTTSCPSGVQYDQLIAAVRPQVERNHERSLPERLVRSLIFSLFPYPTRLRAIAGPLYLYQKLGLSALVKRTGLLTKLSPSLAAMETLLPPITAESFQDDLPELVPAVGQQRYRVGMVLGCVQRVFFSDVNAATARVLSANGCEVVIPHRQGCCSALPAHQGQEAQAQTLARQMIDCFEAAEVDFVVINAAGCGHTLKEYHHILQDDPEYRDRAQAFVAKVRDVQEFLAQVGLTTPLHPLTNGELPIVYQDACHLIHGQKISLQPRQLLKQIPGITLREPIDAALCCGSAGVYNMLNPEVATELGQMKVKNLLNTGAALVASPNPGCSLQIQQHMAEQPGALPLFHPIELLDFSMRGMPLPSTR
jgi:glycolate oxidase iron-sulfur subunit